MSDRIELARPIPRRRAVLAGGAVSGLLSGVQRASAQNADQAATVLADTAVLFPGFRQERIKTSGAVINTLVGGSGPPLLLIHGHPETHVAWWKVAPKLAERFTVVAPDMRGYGDSSKPDGGADHANYSKRAMGQDMAEVMQALGHRQFQAVGHDRGGRVLHHLMLDSPDVVQRGVVLDICPANLMYARTNEEFATKYFWWFFHVQAAPLPETMINSQTELYLRDHLDVQNKTPGAIAPEAFAEYLRCYRDPACVHAVCEDYRAEVTIDRQQIEEATKQGRKVKAPLFAIWGSKGTVGQLFDVIALWQQQAEQVAGQALPCGHLIAEEDPDGLMQLLGQYLQV